MNLTQFAEWLIEAYHSDDGMPEAKEICREARAALSAQPVEGAVATDESGWLIEHSGEILPGAEQRAQVSWLRVQMKFNGYGAREFGFTHDANEALRFSRREDAEAVLAMHLGASPPDWYSKPFSVTEHMWPAASQAQAAPAPDPSAQAVAGAVATEPSEEIQELRAQVEAWRKQCETLTNQVICCGVAARHPDATLTTRGAYAGKWNSPQAEEVRKLRAERDALLAASPQPEPSAQGEPVATVTEEMVTAYLTANDAYWKRIDGEPTKLGKWRNGTPSEATRVSLMAALASAPSTPPHADPIDMVLHCPACGLQHIDAPDERTPDWKNEPHRSHLCHGCWHIWRPADVPTNGVQATKTKGKADSPPPTVVEAVPLNFDQLQSVMSQHFGGRELTDDEADSAEAFARAIERAHGIAPKAAQP